jgi:release factor glutamine methyltransferase
LETESLVLGACARVNFFDAAIDVGTWSGAIALALASRYPNIPIGATDISSQAIAVALSNGRDNNLTIDLRQGNLLDAFLGDALYIAQLRGKRLFIIANLPYIPLGLQLPSDVEKWDPAIALWGWKYWYELIEQLIEQLKILTSITSVFLACEVFEGHAVSLSQKYARYMSSIDIWKDQCWVDRHILFTYPYGPLSS